MRKFLINLIKHYILIFIFLYPFRFLIEGNEKVLIKNGTETNFLKWSEFNKLDSCNTIFLGSSKIYCSIRPKLFDSITKLKSYNLGTGSQSVIESFYFLKYAKKVHDVQNVVFDLFESSMINVDFMHLRRNMQYLDKQEKFQLYKNSGFAKQIFCDLIPILEYSKYLKLKLPESIKNNFTEIHVKNTQTKNNEWEKGYSISNKDDVSSKTESNTTKKHLNLIKRKLLKNLNYLDSLMDFCHSNEINLILTNIPQGSYSQKTKNESLFFREYLKKYKFFLFFDAYPKLESYDIRSDGFHINNNGACKLTSSLGEFIIKNNSYK